MNENENTATVQGNVKDFTTDQLLEELEKRETAQPEKPAFIPAINVDIARLLMLGELAKGYVDGLAEIGRPPNDAERYMFEQAMEVFFGDGIWNFVNSFDF